MGNFSRDTYDRLNHYVGVRLQQGVPILDADWNEAHDIRRFELQAFLKWFVGNGVPLGSDGFAVGDVGAEDDFSIADGRCLVEGWDAVNDWTDQNAGVLTYKSQSLFGNAELAGAWSVAELPALATPSGERTDTVYLDVWEREVDAAEDDGIVNPDIGIETAVRTRLEWVVRVAEGAAAPPSAPAGHVYYPLARLAWKLAASGSAVLASVTDLRRTGLNVQSHHDVQQVVADAFGNGYSLNGNGQTNLKVSLREAVNALLTGSLPGTPPQHLTLNTVDDMYAAVCRDADGDLWAFWQSNRIGSTDTLWYSRFDRGSGSWTQEANLSTPTQYDLNQRVISGDAGDVWIFWSASLNGVTSVFCRRHDKASGTWDETTQLTVSPDQVSGYYAFEDSVGDVWLFWSAARDGVQDLWFKRYDRTGNAWGATTQLTSTNVADGSPFAVEDKTGRTWLFWISNVFGSDDIWYMTHDGTGWSPPKRLTSDAAMDSLPFAVADDSGDVWIFWSRGSDIWLIRYFAQYEGWGVETQLTSSPNFSYDQFATLGGNGDLWVVWAEGGYIQAKRYTREGGWGLTINVSPADIGAFASTAVLDGDQDVVVFWTAFTGGDNDFSYDISFRKFVTDI